MKTYYGKWCWTFALLPTVWISSSQDWSHSVYDPRRSNQPDIQVIKISVQWLCWIWSARIK